MRKAHQTGRLLFFALLISSVLYVNLQSQIATEIAFFMSDEFALSILDTGDPTRVIAVGRCGYDMAIESLSCKQLQALINFHARLSAAAAGRALPRPTAPELAQFGQDLFRLLVQGGIKKIYDRLPASLIRLQIYSNRSDLQAIPWEYMQQPESVPGPDALRSVIRVVPTIGVPCPVPRKLGEKIRLLFVYAEPPREPSIDWLIMKDSIEAQFTSRLPKNFVIDSVEGANKDSFVAPFRHSKYDILHMVCHGVITDGIGYLLFQDVRGKNKEPISGADLASFLRDKELGLVILSACNTATGDFSKEFATVAKTLVENGIPAVVANQFEITNSSAAAFAGAFYAELLNTGDVDRATIKGRTELNFRNQLPNDAARIDWGIPTLYRHLGGAKVFTS
jgi:hypothetical protein